MQTPILSGRYVRLEPLVLDQFEALCAVGLDPELWKWVPNQVCDRQEMLGYVETALEEQRRNVSIPFVTRLAADGQVVGSTRFGNMDLKNRHVEIGWTWIGIPWQRTVVNTEAKYLMLQYAFEVLSCLRVELKTDALNERSRAAIKRIGAKEEGVLRRHMLTASGRMRDTVYYSILDDEWPTVRATLQAKLAG